MNLRNVFAVFVVFLLASCGPPQPQYRTNIELVPPQSQSGRYCANNCLSAKQMCEQSCTMQKQNCTQLNMLNEQNDRLHARQQYEDYVNERTKNGQEIKRSENYYRNYSKVNCENSSCNTQCNDSFNICYGNCGGKVIPHTYCVANCNLAPTQ